MNVYSAVQYLLFVVIVTVCVRPLGGYMHRVFARRRNCVRSIMRSSGTMDLSPRRDRFFGRNGCRSIRNLLRCLYFGRHAPPLRHPPVPTLPSLVFPGISNDTAYSGLILQYSDQFLNHHHMAGLRGRKHHELFQPDGGAVRAEFSRWSRGTGRGHRLHSRTCAGVLRNARKLLGRSHSQPALDSVCLVRSSDRCCLFGREFR
jgi:hypothetical protein